MLGSSRPQHEDGDGEKAGVLDEAELLGRDFTGALRDSWDASGVETAMIDNLGIAGTRGAFINECRLRIHLISSSGGEKSSILPFRGEISYRCFKEGYQKYF